jgi:hypothetical protein
MEMMVLILVFDKLFRLTKVWIEEMLGDEACRAERICGRVSLFCGKL